MSGTVVSMDKLIGFLRDNYPTVTRKGVQVSLLTKGEEYCAITFAKDGTLNMVDKFIYQSSKGDYIRVQTRPNRYMRIYLHEFEGDD